MSRFLTTASTMQSLSVAGMEEASREGRRVGDIEHVLLALVISEQSAGQVLRGLGITLAAAREAVRAQHAHQLRQLGVSVDQDEPGRIVFHEGDGYDWSERALMLMSHSAEGKRGGDAAAVLRALLDEPSGLIAEILARLGTTPDAVRERLDEAQRIPQHPARNESRSHRWVRGRFEVFVPAPIEAVRALLADPKRMPEWEPLTARIEALDAGEPPSAWIAHSLSHRPDGKRIKIKNEFRRRRVELLESEPTHLRWRVDYPDAPRSSPRTFTADLAPAAGGTQVQLTSIWRRRGGWRQLVGWPLRPLQRFFVWMNLFQTAGSISRAFR